MAMGLRGNTLDFASSWKQSPMMSSATSATLVVKRCTTNRWILVNNRRPSLTATTIELKLLGIWLTKEYLRQGVGTYSSVNTRSDASFATSEPAIPIAIPTGASFKAGESLTPSPDIDKCFPLRFPAWIMRTGCKLVFRYRTRG